MPYISSSAEQAKQAECIDRKHHRHGHGKGGHGDDCAADELRLEHLQSATVKEPRQRRRVIRRDGPGRSILTGGK